MLDRAFKPWQSIVAASALPFDFMFFPFDANTGTQVGNFGNVGASAYTVQGTTAGIWGTLNQLTPATDGYIDITDVYETLRLDTLDDGQVVVVAQVNVTALPSSGSVTLLDFDYDNATTGGYAIQMNSSGSIIGRYRGQTPAAIQSITASSAYSTGKRTIGLVLDKTTGLFSVYSQGIVAGTPTAMTPPLANGNSTAGLRLFGLYGSAGALSTPLTTATSVVTVEWFFLARFESDQGSRITTLMSELHKYKHLPPCLGSMG